MSRFQTGALACALTLAFSPAFAASSASASISNLQFQVIDLAPNDGVANSYKTTNLGVTLNLVANDGSVGASESHSFNRTSGMFTFTKSASADGETAQGQASLLKDGLSVSGSANGAQTSFSSSIQSNGSNWPYYYNGGLTLSAHSVLIITADATVRASATNPSTCTGSYYYYCNSSEQANASAFLNLSYSVPTPAGSMQGSASNNLSVNASARGEYSYQTYSYDYSQYDWYYHPIWTTVTVPELEQSLEQSAKFYAVFTNASDVDQFASLSIGALASGNASTGLLMAAGSPSAVPEADSLALAAVGVLTAGFMLRRRRQA